MINSSLFSSVSAEHNTPPAVWAAAVACLGRVDLDPCSPGPGLCPVVSDSYYTIQDNGLAQPWVGRSHRCAAQPGDDSGSGRRQGQPAV